MGPETAGVPCPNCRATSLPSDPARYSWRCPQCGRSYFLRRCAACRLVSHVDGWLGWNQPWDCVWCGESNTGFSQNRDPAAATAAELAADVATHRLALGRPAYEAPPDAPMAPSNPPARASGAIGTGHTAQEMPPAAEVPRPASGVVPTGMRPHITHVAPGARRSGRLIVAIAVPACAVLVAAAMLARPAVLSSSAGMAPLGSSTPAHTVSVITGSVSTVVFRGVPGQLAIVGTGGGQVKLTGQLSWAGDAPAVTTRFNNATHELDLFYQCARHSPCTEDYQLAVPGSTAVLVTQPSARVVITGLAAPLSITASNVDISATGLRSPTLAAGIVSGHLDARFAAPPASVDIMLQSAQATVRLPASTAYQVTQQVNSGSLYVGVPQAGNAAHAVSVQISSGELALLPS